HLRHLLSFPTRRSSDLGSNVSSQAAVQSERGFSPLQRPHFATCGFLERLIPRLLSLCARQMPRRDASLPERPPATSSGSEASRRDRKSTRLNSSHRTIS